MINTEKAKRLLRKIKALIDNLEDQDSASSLERDLLKSYLRDVYEVVNEESTLVEQPSQIQNAPEKNEAQPEMNSTADFSETPSKVEETPSHQKFESAEKPEPEQKAREVSAIDQPLPPEAENSEATAEEPDTTEETKIPEPEPVTVGEEVRQTSSDRGVSSELRQLFDLKFGDDIADRLQSQPIDSIPDEMGINERILTINELFGGDPAAFTETIDGLNSQQDYEGAREYLMKGPASRFNWADQERTQKARMFIQLVRRKFV